MLGLLDRLSKARKAGSMSETQVTENHVPPVSGEAPTIRSRTYSWSDPFEVLPTLAELSGRELLQAMVDGTIPYPPIARDARLRLLRGR